MSGFSCLSHGYPSITVSLPRDVTRSQSLVALPCTSTCTSVYSCITPPTFGVPSTFLTGIFFLSHMKSIFFSSTKVFAIKFAPFAPQSMRAIVSTFRFPKVMMIGVFISSVECVTGCISLMETNKGKSTVESSSSSSKNPFDQLAQ